MWGLGCKGWAGGDFLRAGCISRVFEACCAGLEGYGGVQLRSGGGDGKERGHVVASLLRVLGPSMLFFYNE